MCGEIVYLTQKLRQSLSTSAFRQVVYEMSGKFNHFTNLRKIPILMNYKIHTFQKKTNRNETILNKN